MRIICNQTYLKEFDYVYSSGMKMRDWDIVGISKDVNFETLHSDIRPMCFITQDIDYFPNYFFIKMNGENTPQTIEYLKTAWEKLSDTPFDLHFLDETLDNLYKTESNLAKLISIFGLIAVVIAVMGVYGLIAFNARYKAKEIAIRKVNGSTIREIILMLNWNVLLQLGIAFAIAVPVVWFIIKKWLENFAYKIAIYWWVFLLGGLIVLLITVLTVSVQSYQAAVKNPTVALNME
jgi:putative ABC transport system permease protein